MTTSGLRAFAFQTGAWRVHHRKLRQRLCGCDHWDRFGGTCLAWELMDGAANVEDNFLDDPSGPYRAVAFRRLEPGTGDWSIWWADGRFPGLDLPMRGRFEEGVGTFLAEDRLDGRPILVRFVWSGTLTDTPRWEQAFSEDGGASWEVNWIMDFERAGACE